MQSGLALSERDCGLRVCDLADSRDRPLLKVQRLRTRELRSAPRRAGPAGTRTSDQIVWATGRAPARQRSTGVEKRRIRIRRRRRATPAAVLTPRAYLCSLSASDWVSLRGISGRVRHLAANSQLLIAWSWHTDLFSEEKCAGHSIQAIFARSVLAQESAETPSHVGSAKTLGNGPSRASPAGASIAYPGRPLVTLPSMILSCVIQHYLRGVLVRRSYFYACGPALRADVYIGSLSESSFRHTSTGQFFCVVAIESDPYTQRFEHSSRAR